jgi:hypothetical protein
MATEDDIPEQTEVLGSHKLATDGPFKIEMKVKLIGVSGEYEGYEAWVDIDLPPGKVPTDEDIEKRLANALEAAGDSFRLADRKDFVRGLLCEQAGVDMNFSVPGPNEFRLSTPHSTEER